MDVYNIFDGELEVEEGEPPGFGTLWVRVGDRIGARRLGMSVYALEGGERICPYHFEWASEEWLIVLEGEPELRTPEGRSKLRPGDVVCFPPGPDGAHDVTGPAKVAMLSTKDPVDVAEYPDSDKIGVFTPTARYLLRRHPELEYYDGETT